MNGNHGKENSELRFLIERIHLSYIFWSALSYTLHPDNAIFYVNTSVRIRLKISSGIYCLSPSIFSTFFPYFVFFNSTHQISILSFPSPSITPLLPEEDDLTPIYFDLGYSLLTLTPGACRGLGYGEGDI